MTSAELFSEITMERGVPIRSICRSIAVLQSINRSGSLSLMEIARTTSIPYPTACRIIQTLILEGLVECEPSRKRYRATALVQSLSLGFQSQSSLVTVARPVIVALTEKLFWPLTITTRVGNSMMVCDSTHTLTSLTFNNYYPGYTIPILECASGHVYLAYAAEHERKNLIKGLEQLNGKSTTLAMFESGKMIERIREDGLATRDRNVHTANPGKTSSFAVPIFEGSALVGTLTFVYFASSMPTATAVSRYGPEIKEAAVRIGRALAECNEKSRQLAERKPPPMKVSVRSTAKKSPGLSTRATGKRSEDTVVLV